MQKLNIATNCRTIPKHYAHVQPYRENKQPTALQIANAIERKAQAEITQHEILRDRVMRKRNKIAREMKTLFAFANLQQ